MKVCYFIQSHKNPEQILRLVRAIKRSSNNCHIIISHDFSTSYLDLNQLSDRSNIDLIRRYKPARRGDASILEIYLEAVEHLVRSGIDFDWFVCLSGQDYPIQPVSKFEEFLTKTEYDGFLNYHDVLLDRHTVKGREKEKFYFSQSITLPAWTKQFLKKFARLEFFFPFLKVQWLFAMIGIKAQNPPFNNNFRCYWGFYWNTLSKECLMYFRHYLKTHPKLLQYYLKTLAPEESIITSVLVNSQKFKLSQAMLQYSDFPAALRGVAAPIFAEDLPNLIEQNYYFARKFNLDEDRELFELLDNCYLAEYQKV